MVSNRKPDMLKAPDELVSKTLEKMKEENAKAENKVLLFTERDHRKKTISKSMRYIVPLAACICLFMGLRGFWTMDNGNDYPLTYIEYISLPGIDDGYRAADDAKISTKDFENILGIDVSCILGGYELNGASSKTANYASLSDTAYTAELTYKKGDSIVILTVSQAESIVAAALKRGEGIVFLTYTIHYGMDESTGTFYAAFDIEDVHFVLSSAALTSGEFFALTEDAIANIDVAFKENNV